MARLSKQVKDFMWKKITERIEEILAPLAAEVKEEENRIKQTVEAAELEAVAAFQSVMASDVPNVWEYVCKVHPRSIPYVSSNGTYKLYDTEKKMELSRKRREMTSKAEDKFNELIMNAELGGIKKDEVLAMISSMELG